MFNLKRDSGMINKWFDFDINNDDGNARECKNKIINRFAFIATILRTPDKAVSKNEYDRLLGYSFILADKIKSQRSQRDSLTRQTQILESVVSHTV